MPLYLLEALLGLAAIALCAVACWREDRLIAWEDKCDREMKQRKEDNSHDKRKLWWSACGKGQRNGRF